MDGWLLGLGRKQHLGTLHEEYSWLGQAEIGYGWLGRAEVHRKRK